MASVKQIGRWGAAGFGVTLFGFWALGFLAAQPSPDNPKVKWALGALAAQSSPDNAKGKFADKVVTFEMRSMPWSNVFEWLTDQTGLPVITNHKPSGSFDFYS